MDKNLQSVIHIRDKINSLETLWQPTNFLDWIYRLRNCDIEDLIKELRRKGKWEFHGNGSTEIFEDSLNNSKISINMTPVKRQLNESIHFSMDASMLETTMYDHTSIMHDQQKDVNACLTQIEVAAKTLNKLCRRYQNNNIEQIVESLGKMQDIIESLKSILQNKDSSESEDVSANSINSANNTVIDMSSDIKSIFKNKDTNECKDKDAFSIDSISNNDVDKSTTGGDTENCSSHMSPKKSSMRNNVLDMKTENVQKNVRFTNKTEQ